MLDTQSNSALRDGIKVLSQNETVSFTKYTRYILPIDGYVFWIRSGLANPDGNRQVPILSGLHLGIETATVKSGGSPSAIITLDVSGMTAGFLQVFALSNDPITHEDSVIFTGPQITAAGSYVMDIAPIPPVFQVCVMPQGNADAAYSVAVDFNPVGVTATPNTLTVQGSFHYSSSQEQGLDKTIAFQNVLFTTAEKIQDFNDIQQDELYLGSYDDFRFAFSGHGGYYQAAGLWHYTGQAVYPTMLSQIIDDLSQIDFYNVIASNSLPLWLGLCQFAPVFPSFLVPENLPPPYVVAHIGENSTTALQATALTIESGVWQLMADRVKLVLYGFSNREAMNYLVFIQNKSMNGDYGLMGAVTIKDQKTIQSELNTLAQCKAIEFQASYNQQSVFDSSIKYINSVLPITVAGINHDFS